MSDDEVAEPTDEFEIALKAFGVMHLTEQAEVLAQFAASILQDGQLWDVGTEFADAVLKVIERKPKWPV